MNPNLHEAPAAHLAQCDTVWQSKRPSDLRFGRQKSMDPDQQFWWNWAINFAVACGTLLTVLVAVFGDKFRARFFPPILKLQLVRPKGELTTETGPGGSDRVRFYHLCVSNGRRWSPAREVQVFLTRIEEPGPNDQLQVRWFGNVPMRWRDQEVVPIMRTIGADADIDFCRVGQKTGLALMPLITPNNLEAKRPGKCRLVASLQARSNEADSEVIRAEVAWDGSWEEGESEMQHHFVVRQIASETS